MGEASPSPATVVPSDATYHQLWIAMTHLLVLGAPRSGTTLLAAMIGCHDQVGMLSEDFGTAVRHIVGKPVVGNKLCVPNHIEMRQTRPEWVRLVGTRGFHKLHQYGYFRYRPEALLCIEDYLSWENVKLIAIIRDGNAVVSSIMKRGEQPYEVAAYRWRRSIEVISELRNEHPETLLVLSFEHLVKQPAIAMHRVAEHLGLPFQSQMLEGYRYTRAYPNENIDPTRVESSRASRLVTDLSQTEPEAYAQYEALRASCMPTKA